MPRFVAGALSMAALLSVASTAARAEDVSKLAPDLAALISGRQQQQQAPAPSGASLSPARRASSMAEASSTASRMKVIVRTRGQVTRSVRESMWARGSRVGRTFPSVGAVVVEATPEQLLSLTDDPNVVSVSPDREVRSAAALDVNRQAIGTGEAIFSSGWNAYTGRGVGVAVIDSGVAMVPDLAGRVAAFKDMVNGRDHLPYDDFGHGTHVAGIIAGSGLASSGPGAETTYRGVAPGAHLVGVKVLDAQGAGSVSDVIAGIDWCIANRRSYNIRVINLSLGGGVFESYKTDPLCQAAERAVAAGIVVVASAGNWGGWYGTVGCPGNDPNVVTVGASNTRGTAGRSDDAITTYTGRGPTRFDVNFKPDVLAPGNDIVSLRAPGATLDTLYPETRVPTTEYLDRRVAPYISTSYTRLSGTSMAAPAVAAVAALVLQANPALEPNGVKAAMMFSAQLLSGYDPVTKLRGVYDPLTQGAGQINPVGAVEVARLMRRWGGLTDMPSLTTTLAGETFAWAGAEIPTLIQRPGLVWGDNLVWGGTSGRTIDDAQRVWGNNLVWGGTSGLAEWQDSLVWGNNLVWGGTSGLTDVPPQGTLIWANNLVWGGTSGRTHPQDRGLINGQNLVWGGTSGFAPGDERDDSLYGNNLVWGGTSGLVRPDPTTGP